ncbi:MAG: hypothetical protein JW950_04040 [Deltaproteobacteria bacterium]|nr:hypothetical protein [Deltaproteobacteria bacterium]
MARKGGAAERHPGKCIGCEPLVSISPSESLELVPRSDRQRPLHDNGELMVSIAASFEYIHQN